MSEFERLEPTDGLELRHPLACFCVPCCRWFAAAPSLAGGRCRRCHEPIDRHALEDSGRVKGCPVDRT